MAQAAEILSAKWDIRLAERIQNPAHGWSTDKKNSRVYFQEVLHRSCKWLWNYKVVHNFLKNFYLFGMVITLRLDRYICTVSWIESFALVTNPETCNSALRWSGSWRQLCRNRVSWCSRTLLRGWAAWRFELGQKVRKELMIMLF